MITPADIENKEFSRGVRGYKEDEVDEFLDLIILDMEKLLKEYREILSEDIPASKRFWKLEKKIREDQKNPGVLIDDMRRSTMLVDLYNLISWQVITLEDLSDFSEDLQKKVAWFTGR